MTPHAPGPVRGDPIVFVPGLMQDARAFLPQIVELGARHSAQVFIPDGDAVEKLAERLLQDAPPRFVLVGHGLGASVGFDVLRRAPERLIRMVLIGADPLAEAPQIAAGRESRLVAARAGLLKQAIADELPAAALADTPDRATVLALVQDMALGLGEGVYMRQSRALQRRPDQQKTLRRNTVPTLFLAGPSDSVLPLRRVEFTRDMMPFSALKQIPDTGHLPMLEAPEAVSSALGAFLAGPMILR